MIKVLIEERVVNSLVFEEGKWVIEFLFEKVWRCKLRIVGSVYKVNRIYL